MNSFFGNRDEFSLEFYDDGKFECWIRGNNICEYYYNNIKYCTYKPKCEIADWFKQNIDAICSETLFPLNVFGNSSVELYHSSGKYKSDNIDEFSNWYEIRQDWYFRHSWYISRNGECLPDVYFRRINDKIEINWYSKDLYDDVYFLYESGIYYIDFCEFYYIVQKLMLSEIH